MVADGSSAAGNIFALDGPTATGTGLLRAAASFTAETTRGLRAGFDLQARFEGAVDAKLTEAVRASFRGSASASVGAEASAYFPVDVFDFAGVVATLKAQAEARASVKLDVELRTHELLAAVFADTAGSLWRPYVDAIARRVTPRAGIYASAAICVKATAETKAGIRLFPKADEPAGTVFVVNFGYGFIYGYSWGLLAELSLDEPAVLVRDVFGVTARQLAAAFEAESARRPEPMRSVLAEAGDLVELVVPALAGLLCTLLADVPEADRPARLTASATTLAAQLGQHLLEQLVSAALDGLGTLVNGLGLPVGPDVGNTLLALLNAVADAVVAGRSALSVLPDAIDAIVETLFELARLGLGDADRQLLQDVAVGIWAGVSLIEADPGFTRPPTSGIRQLLLEQGIDPAVGAPGDLPARALGRSATRLLRRTGAATWLCKVTGLVLEDLLRMPLRGITGDPVQFLRTFLAAVASAVSRELLDEIPIDGIGVPSEAVESVRSILQIALEELPDLLDDLSTEQVLRRLRERVSVGLLASVGPPLVSFLENVAREGFALAVPEVRRLETQARNASDLIPQFPRGGPLERFTSALEDLGRESIDVTLGLPTSELLGHLAAKLDRWRTQRLPVELALMRDTVCLTGESSTDLLAALDASDIAVVVDALVALAEHHLDQIRSITQFLVEDSADLLVRLTTLPFEQAARLFAASVKFSFELAAAMIAELSRVAADVDRRIDELQSAAASQVADLALQCAQLSELVGNAVDRVIDGIISDLVGNDPLAQFAARVAFNALTGGIAPVVARALGDVATTLRVAGESIAAAARAGTLGASGALSILDESVRATASQGVSIPITLLIPVFPPFYFVNVTVATVSVPAEWLGRALWGAITNLAGTGPLIAAIDDTARSLQLTNSALDAARSAGTSDQIRQRAAQLDSQVSAAVLNQPIAIEFDAGNPQSVTTVGSEAVVTGRVSGIDRSYVVPLDLADGARSTIIPARVRFTCQGVPIPPQTVTWTDVAPGTLAFRFRATTHASGNPLEVVVRPGVCVVNCVAAMGAWDGKSDEVGTSQALTLLLVPAPTSEGRHAAIDGWSSPDGTAHVAYLSAASQTERHLILLTRGLDGAWSTDDITAASVAPPTAGTGLTGWSDETGDVHLAYSAEAGGLQHVHRDSAGAWTTELVENGGQRHVMRSGRPLRIGTNREELVYLNERGELHVAVTAGPAGGWRVTDLTTSTGVPSATPAADLLHWEAAAVASTDLVADGNLLSNPAFTDSPRNRWEHAAFWTGWTQRREGRVMLTQLRPSTLPVIGSRRMLHVSTTIDTAGVVQVFGPQDTGPQRVESAAWVYVLRGEVGMGTGNGGNTGYDTRTAERGRWIRLSAPNGVSPANEFIVYATSAGGAEFFVAGASVRELGTRARGAATTNLAYGGADGHIYRLTREPPSSTWQVTDLTALAGALAWQPGTDLTTWTDTAGTRHVSFWAIDAQLYDLAGPETGSGWNVQRLGEQVAGRRLRRGSLTSNAATVWASGDARGLVCTGPGGLARAATSVGGAGPWTWTAPAAGRQPPLPASRGALVSWMEAADSVSVAMIDRNRRVYLLSGAAYDSDWTITDLTHEATAPPAAGTGG